MWSTCCQYWKMNEVCVLLFLMSDSQPTCKDRMYCKSFMQHTHFCNVLLMSCIETFHGYVSLNSGLVKTPTHSVSTMMCSSTELSECYLLCLLFCFSTPSLWPPFTTTLLCPSVFCCPRLLALQLTLTPAQQQLLIQQAQAQILAAAVQHSASQQNSTTGASISASAATPITQLPLSQPIQIAPVSNSHLCTTLLQELKEYLS